MPIKNLKELRDRFRLFGVDTIYIKRLSAKQDNDKNQIYLGSGLDGWGHKYLHEPAIRPLATIEENQIVVRNAYKNPSRV